MPLFKVPYALYNGSVDGTWDLRDVQRNIYIDAPTEDAAHDVLYAVKNTKVLATWDAE
jgi:hypothetical protein